MNDNTPSEVRGTVRKVFQDKPGRYAIYVTVEGNASMSETKFSGFGKCPWKEQEACTFVYALKQGKDGKTYANIVGGASNGIAQGDEEIAAPHGQVSQERRINRAVAWKVGAELIKTMGVRPFKTWADIVALVRTVEDDLNFKGGEEPPLSSLWK